MMEYERLVDAIYEAAAVPGEWPKVLHELAVMVEGAGTIMVTRRRDNWLGSCTSPGVEIGAKAYIRSENATRSIAPKRLIDANRCGFVPDNALFTEEEMVSDPYYTDWASLNDTHHGAATAIQVPGGDYVFIQVQRRKGLPVFDRACLDRLDAFRPHLARAGLLATRWQLERLRGAAEALAMIGLPAAILDLSGRVLTANTLIQEMRGHVLWLPNDGVALSDRTANKMLVRAVADLRIPAASTVRSFAARGDGGDLAVAHVIPAVGHAREIFGGAFGVLVITLQTEAPVPDAALIQGLFDLTPAEARVAQGIATGSSLQEIAKGNHVTYETVRSQVKSILAKTGTERQSQVVSLLGGIQRLNLR